MAEVRVEQRELLEVLESVSDALGKVMLVGANTSGSTRLSVAKYLGRIAEAQLALYDDLDGVNAGTREVGSSNLLLEDTRPTYQEPNTNGSYAASSEGSVILAVPILPVVEGNTRTFSEDKVSTTESTVGKPDVTEPEPILPDGGESPKPATETKTRYRPNGRRIERFPDADLDHFNLAQRRIIGDGSLLNITTITITGDKTINIDGLDLNFRVPKDGNPSIVMQVLNVALRQALYEDIGALTREDFTNIVTGDPKFNQALLLALKKFLGEGVFEEYTQPNSEVLIGLPRPVRLVDERNKRLDKSVVVPRPEDTPDFLV